MGGPMGVYEREEYPFRRDERRLIESALASQRPVPGVCRESQLLAATLDAAEKKGEKKELGWYPVPLALNPHEQHADIARALSSFLGTWQQPAAVADSQALPEPA